MGRHAVSFNATEGNWMPDIQISMFAGRTHAEKQELVRQVTEAFVQVLKVEKEWVRIRIQEVDRENQASGGVLYSDRDSPAADGSAKRTSGKGR